MRYLLDSNILIALALDADEAIVSRAAQCDADDMVTSAVAFAEVVHGSERGKPPPLDRLAIIAEEIPVLPFDEPAARAYAAIPFKRASYDRLIAAHALSLVGERWGLLVVRELMLGPKRFTDLRVGLPNVSPNVLARRLRDLEEVGVIKRKVYTTKPPLKVEYSLTDFGKTLIPLLHSIANWGDFVVENMPGLK